MVGSFFSIRVLVFFCVLVTGLAGCSSMTGGTMGRAWTANSQCEVLLAWVKQFEQEFPLRSIGLYGGQSRATVANLYRPEVFEPVFGFPYEKAHEGTIKEMTEEILPPCSGSIKGAKPETVQAFRPLKILVDAEFPFQEAMARAVAERIKEEEWRKQALSEIADIPATQDGFANIQDYYLRTGEQEIQNLWTSDQKAYLRRVKARRGEIGKILLDQLLPEPDMFPASFASLENIRAAEPYLLALKESGDQDLRHLAERYTAQKHRIVEKLIGAEVDDLMRIPHNEDGFHLTKEWFEEFQRVFAPYADTEAMQQAVGNFQGKRQAIFENNRRMIYSRFAELGLGNTARQQEEKLIAETFPLPSDYHLPFYREFRANYRNKGNSVVLDMLDKTKNAVMDYYDAVSGFAKGWLHGTPE